MRLRGDGAMDEDDRDRRDGGWGLRREPQVRYYYYLVFFFLSLDMFLGVASFAPGTGSERR